MAGNTEHSSATGSMNAADMTDHVRTWRGFVRFMYWLVGGSAAVLVFLAIFRTHG